MNIWCRNGNCVSTMSPAPDDLFVVTTLFGKRVLTQPITHYETALATAQRFAEFVKEPRPVVVKLFCLSGIEMADAMGIDPATLFAGQSPEEEAEMRQLVVNNCKDALRDSPSAAIRADAIQLLTDMRVMQ